MADSGKRRVAYEVVQPEGYTWKNDIGGPVPFFEPMHQGGRRLYLVCYTDGTVGWELRARDGAVLEPSDDR